jgi:ATP-binding cassette, subfamily C (CFTR/MRP), member 1
MGNRIKIGLMNVIYKKSLRLSNTGRRGTTVGEMTNLITTNTTTYEWCGYYLTGALSSPFQIAICTYLLYKYIGVASLVGLSTMIVFLPLNAYFASISKKIRRKKYELQDSRIKMMNEILNGIRVIKFYGWEESFKKLIEKIRSKEIRNLIKTALVSALTSFTWTCAPYAVACVSFMTYLLINKEVYILKHFIFSKKLY